MADPLPETTHAPVRRVELFEDRAAVTREVALGAAGRHRLRIGPVSPAVSERAITFPGGARATLEEVRVHRVRTTRREADPAAIVSLEAAWREASDAARAAADAHQRANERTARALAALDAAVAATPRALSEHDAPAAWVDAVAALGEALRAARREEAETLAASSIRQQEETRTRSLLEEARRGRPVMHAFIELSLLAEQPGELLLRYVIPCAVWRPSHRATLTTDPPTPKIHWELAAVCWNASGEDWSDVPELVCSTARPGDLAEPPQLVDDVVDVGRRDREVVVEARDETIHVARERGSRAAADAPGVDDGGEPRTFTARAPVTLPSDGRPVTVQLDAWEAEATARWLALPERSGAAVLRVVVPNAGSRPILAGPVALVRDGTAIGRGRVPLVAPGEPFPLGFGSHDGLRIRRRRDHETDRTALTGRQWRTFKIEVGVVHLGADPCRLEVRERVPTSELKEVNVSAPIADPPLDAPMDKDGFCRWILDLSPGESRTLKLSYTVDAASNVRLPF